MEKSKKSRGLFGDFEQTDLRTFEGGSGEIVGIVLLVLVELVEFVLAVDGRDLGERGVYTHRDFKKYLNIGE